MSLGNFLLRKTAIAVATMVAVSFLIFLALEVNIEEVAVCPPSAPLEQFGVIA